MITYPYTIGDVANEVGVPIPDIGLLASLISDDPRMYDRVTERLSDEGREHIVGQIKSGH